MEKVDTSNGYDFYIQFACGNTPFLYNIVPEGSPPPNGGYPNMEFIEKQKRVLFPDRYRRRTDGSR